MQWSNLVSEKRSVPAFRSLRLEEEGTLQFVQGRNQFFAVRKTEPYGLLTATSAEILPAEQTHLLHQAARGEDFTIFELPEDLLALRAVTLGTGRNRFEQLKNTYRRVGETAGQLITQYPTPELSVDDFAIVRHTGQVLVVPPMRFGEGHQDLEAHGATIAKSLVSTLDWLPSEAVLAIAREVGVGMKGHGNGDPQ